MPRADAASAHRPAAQDAARREAEAVARRSYGKLVALLAARSGDLAAAEDALADAFAAALAEWPRGRPSNPEAWLLTVARRKLIDAARRRRSGEAALEHWQRLADGIDAADDAVAIPDRQPGPDVRLRASGDRRRHPRAADAAGGAQASTRSASPARS